MLNLAELKSLEDQTRRGQIVRQLRDLIVGGQVTPGDRLTETDLANRLGVSRAPLRNVGPVSRNCRSCAGSRGSRWPWHCPHVETARSLSSFSGCTTSSATSPPRCAR